MKKLLNKNFVLLWQGQFVSRMGTQVFLIAMLAWIKDTTDSGIMLGTISAIAGAVAIALGPFCGVFADRNSRKKIIVVTDILNGILMVAFANQLQREKGKTHQMAIRALAFKWIRILHRCWMDRKPYDEAKYLMALKAKGSPLVAAFAK